MEQLALFRDSEQLFRCVSDRSWFSVNQRETPTGPLRENIYPVLRMPDVLVNLDYSVDTYISQHSYNAPHRRLATLSALSCAHIDIDWYKSEFVSCPIDFVVDQVLYRCECEGIPPPSLIVNSGRGLYLKWIWTTPLPGAALPRWNAVERSLLKSFFDFEADKKATLGTQILRIEGSMNLKGGQVGVVWTNGQRENPIRYDFDVFCDLVLPYSRAEAQAYKAEMARRGCYLEEIKKNLALRDAKQSGGMRTPAPTVAKLLEQDLVGELWANRYSWINRLAVYRFGESGVPDGGGRNEFCWLAANALAWQTRTPVEILACIRRLVPTYSSVEAKNRATAVLGRLNQNKLYRLTDKTLIERLSVTQSELAAVGRPSGSAGVARASRANEGILKPELDAKLGVMKGLGFHDYQTQKQERQRLGAKYTHNERKANTRARILQAKAELRSAGKTPTAVAIARVTGLDRAGLLRNHRDLLD